MQILEDNEVSENDESKIEKIEKIPKIKRGAENKKESQTITNIINNNNNINNFIINDPKTIAGLIQSTAPVQSRTNATSLENSRQSSQI